ncbi:MAG: ankyrin repeat domain-containing protein [Rickettsiales bacterium]|jgi:ankyrin repeat protein|nr:ankyrin repeat domain-containing protein [Rickettsiales bacterium]
MKRQLILPEQEERIYKILKAQEERIYNFFKAIEENEFKVVEEMLSERPDLIHEILPHKKISISYGALSYAFIKKRHAIAKYLIKFGADVNSVNYLGNSILQQALSSRANNLVIDILERKELIIYEGYHINSFLLFNSPALLARSLYLMILKSYKSLKTLLCEDSFYNVSLSSIFIKSLLKLYNQDVLSADQQEAMLLTIKELGGAGEEIEEEIYAEINASKIDEGDREIVAIFQQSMDNYAEIREPIVAAVRAQGYELHEVPRDGNCFFTALASSIFNDLDSDSLNEAALRLRGTAVKFMLYNPNEFIPFFETREDLYWYIDRLGVEGEEADHPVIQALSDYIRIVFVIHHGSNTYSISPRGGADYHREYHVAYDGRHYDGLIDLNNDIRRSYDLVRAQDNSVETAPLSSVTYQDDYGLLFTLEELLESNSEDSLMEEYEELLSESWFLGGLDYWMDQYEVIEQRDAYMIMTGLVALYIFIPDKFEGHI